MQRMLKFGRLAFYATDVVAVEDITSRDDNGTYRLAAILHFKGGGAERVTGFELADIVLKIEEARADGMLADSTMQAGAAFASLQALGGSAGVVGVPVGSDDLEAAVVAQDAKDAEAAGVYVIADDRGAMFAREWDESRGDIGGVVLFTTLRLSEAWRVPASDVAAALAIARCEYPSRSWTARPAADVDKPDSLLEAPAGEGLKSGA